MIDGIPNRPLYFYKNNIIGLQSMAYDTYNYLITIVKLVYRYSS